MRKVCKKYVIKTSIGQTREAMFQVKAEKREEALGAVEETVQKRHTPTYPKPGHANIHADKG